MAETLTAEAVPLRSPGQLIAVAAHRARRLSVLGQPNTRAAAILGWASLPALWGVHMAIAGTTAGQIQILGGASAALEGTSRSPRRPLMMAVGLTAYLLFAFALAIPAAIASVDRSALPTWLAVPYALLAVDFAAVILSEIFVRLVRAVRSPESRSGALRARRNELGQTGAPAYFAVSLVSGRRGRQDGKRLFSALAQQLRDERAVAVLYPADAGLVQLYTSWGARLDDGAQRRMLLDYR